MKVNEARGINQTPLRGDARNPEMELSLNSSVKKSKMVKVSPSFNISVQWIRKGNL